MTLQAYQIGSIGELHVSQRLLEAGHQVFKNVCGGGPADLTAWDGERVVLIDVKNRTVPYYRKDGSPSTGYYSRLREDGVWEIVILAGEIQWPADFPLSL